MDRIKIAKELVKLARDITAMEFDSPEAMKKYLKEHPDADKSKHTVKKQEQGKKKETARPSRRAEDFFGDSKQGKLINKILSGRWDERKVMNFLENLHPESIIKSDRALNRMEKEIGAPRTPDSKSTGEQMQNILKYMKPLYEEYSGKTASEQVKLARELTAAPNTPFEKALEKAIASKIRELKRDGVDSMGIDNLMQVVRPPSSSLDGAPRGTNASYYYKEMFRDVARGFRFVTANRKRESKLMSRQQKILDKWLETSEGERAVSRGHVFYDDLPDNLRRQLERVKDQETLWMDVERYLGDAAMNKRFNSSW